MAKVKMEEEAAHRLDDQTLATADGLHSAAIHLLRRVRTEDAATGESPARLSALSVLVFGGVKTLGELAAAEGVKPPTMSRMAAGLAKSRLITITHDASDGRRVHIRATEKGRRMLLAGRQRRVEALAEQLSALSREELGRLNGGLEIVRRLLANWR